MDYGLLQAAVDFHGNQLIEVLQAEQGDSFTSNVCFKNVQESNEKHCALSDDRKKMLVSFIAQKADILFKTRVAADGPSLKLDFEDKDYYAVMPPLECYMEFTDESRKRHFYESLSRGEVVIGTVSAIHTRGLIIELICVSVGKMRHIHDLNLKCFCNTHQIPMLSAHEDPLESYHSGDLIQGLVLDVQPEVEKIYISMKEAFLPPHLQQQQIKLGIITDEDLPIHYKQSLRLRGEERYNDTLNNTLGFMNPSVVSHLSHMMRINLNRSESLMRGLHLKEYAKEDFATEIYKVQCAKWAYKSVKQGVQYFKTGNTVGAFQCLNKALQIDPRNVEALVARGALYANNNSFSRAIDDFNIALELNPHHINAGKFAVETLVAFGKRHEEQGCTDEAIKCYQKALLLNPNHSEAMYYMKSSQKKAAKQEKEKARQITQDAEAANKKHAVREEQTVSVTKQKLKQLLNLDKDGKYTNKRSRHSSTSSTSSRSSSTTSDSMSSSSTESSHSRKRKTSKFMGIPPRTETSSGTSSNSSTDQSREGDSKNSRYSSKRTPMSKFTLDRVMRKSRSKRPEKHETSQKRRRHSTGKSSEKKYGKKSRHISKQKKKKRSSSESESSSSNDKSKRISHRRKSNSNSSRSHSAPHTNFQKRGEDKSKTSKIPSKIFQRQDSKTRQECSQNVPADTNSCTSDVSFKSRSSAASHGTQKVCPGQIRLPSISQEKEQVRVFSNSISKPEASTQSLEELESFLASLKAGKNTKQSIAKNARK